MLTNGYDYVFALSQDEVNSILTKNLTGKKINVKYNTKDKDTGTTVTMDFNLLPFQMVTGGDGTNINLKLPVDQGYMSLEGGALASNSYDLTGVGIIVQIQLGWLGAGDDQQVSGSGDNSKLVFSPTTTKGNPGYVSATTILDPDKQLDALGKGLLSATMAAALFSNKSKLQYIFANVNPSPTNLSSWLKPVKWQYYYVGSEPHALCFLCQLSNKPFPKQPTFDAENLDTTNNALVLVSQLAFFNNVILPSVKSSFPSGKFTSSVNPEEAVTIKNSGDFNVGKVTTNSFELTTSDSGNGLAISASGGGPLKFFFGVAKLPNASYSWSVSTNNALKYQDGTIVFQKDPHPKQTHDQTIPWYDWVLLVAVGITNIAGLVSAIVDAVNGFYDDSASMGIGTINTTFQQSVDSHVVNLGNLIGWDSASEEFSPTAAGLQVSLYVRGNLA